jgi:hypothetical protein
MPTKTRKLARGKETKGTFNARLKEEGRYKAFVGERVTIMAKFDLDSTTATAMLLPKYGKGTADTPAASMCITPPGSNHGITDAEIKDFLPPEKVSSTPSRGVGTNHSETYKDRLPNGCPLFDKDKFESDHDTTFHADALWAERNLARHDLTESNLYEHCPSLSCAVYFWRARYTNTGFNEHTDTMKALTIKDQKNVQKLNERTDDKKVLSVLARVHQRVLDHIADDDGKQDD